MQKVTVIIHGWSDASQSFEALKTLLVERGMGTVKTILYADYESREDNVTFSDVCDGLNDEFIRQGLIDKAGKKLASVNIICHSTGGLVIRHWIWRHYFKYKNRMEDCPVKKIVMLAPANFGSPLAHRGKSFFSSLIKGRRSFGDFLETGKQILTGLELGSPYQWVLASGDLIHETPYFTSHKIQTTILVGAEGYKGLAKVANQPGTDGTVVIAGTSLDSAKLTLDFSKPMDEGNYDAYSWTIKKPFGDFAFAVLENLDHGSIVSASSQANSQVSGLVLEALNMPTPQAFVKFQKKLEEITVKTYARTKKPKYQQFMTHAIDDSGQSIRDFTLDFFVWRGGSHLPGTALATVELDKKEQRLSEKMHEAMTAQVHTHQEDPSYRSFIVNLDTIKALLAEAKTALNADVALSMKMFVPDIDEGIRYDTRNMQNIVLASTGAKEKGAPSFFFPNTTTLLELNVNRFNTYVTVQETPRNH